MMPHDVVAHGKFQDSSKKWVTVQGYDVHECALSLNYNTSSKRLQPQGVSGLCQHAHRRISALAACGSFLSSGSDRANTLGLREELPVHNARCTTLADAPLLAELRGSHLHIADQLDTHSSAY